MKALSVRLIHIPLLFILATFAACSASAQKEAAFYERFEQGDKPSYAAAAASMSSGPWQLDNALIGKSDKDHKNGAGAIRIRSAGHATMLFQIPPTVKSIRFRYASFGADGSSQVSVWASGDNGANWTMQGRPWTTTSSLQTAVVKVNLPGRFRLRIQNDGPARVNIDDLELSAAPGNAVNSAAPAAIPAKIRENPLALGNPSHASKENRDNYLLVRPQYSLSYNATKGRANWVAWHLSLDWEGNTPRTNRFLQDAELPDAFFRASSSDYIGSGFDRGHLCPSDDRSGSEEDNAATFLMSNIVPQAPEFNQHSWRELEEYARSLSAHGLELYTLAGVYGCGGTGKNGQTRSLANGKLEVPARFWKILVILPKGENDLSRINKDTRVIAVDMPNEQTSDAEDWRNYRCSVASIEEATGYRFFDALPADVAQALKGKQGDL